MESSAHHLQMGNGGIKVSLVCRAVENHRKKVWIIFRRRIAELELLQRLLGTLLEQSVAVGNCCA